MRLFIVLLAIAACGGTEQPTSGNTGPATDAGVAAADGGAADAGVTADAVSISLSQTDIHIPVGVMTAFAVTATRADGTRFDVTQAAQAVSSDANVASVAHGEGAQIQLTAHAPGSANIVVTYGGLSQTAAVTVSR